MLHVFHQPEELFLQQNTAVKIILTIRKNEFIIKPHKNFINLDTTYFTWPDSD